MSFLALLTQTVSIEHVTEGPGVDDYGVATKAIADTITVAGLLEPISEQEQLVGAETYRTEFHLYLPPGTAIKEQDLVVVDGRQYEVQEILPYFNPRTASAHHIMARVVWIQG